jgi:hypothetical protein
VNTQDRAAIEQMLEMLVDNREYIEANERIEYLLNYDKAIADGEILLRKPIPDYAWPTVQDYERERGFTTDSNFKLGWTMARTTNDLFNQLAVSAEGETNE